MHFLPNFLTLNENIEPETNKNQKDAIIKSEPYFEDFKNVKNMLSKFSRGHKKKKKLLSGFF